MKRILLIIVAIVVLGGGVIFLFNRSKSAPAVQPETANSSQQSTEETKPGDLNAGANSAKAPTKVTTVKVSADAESEITLLGTVKANDQIKVMATAAGQVKSLLVREGSFVKAGDPLATVGGLNETRAPAEIQLQLVEINYEAAQKGLEVANAGNASSLKVAELQLQSAQHQADGSYLDLQVFDTNLDATKDGLFYLHDNYNTTMRKSNLDLEKGQNGLDKLDKAISDLQNNRADLINSYETKIDAEPDQAKRQQLRDELEKQTDAIDKTLDELNAQMDDATLTYDSGAEAVTLAGNQFLSQIQQTEAQGKTAYLNQQSMKTKLGLYDNSSDPVRIATEGLNAVKVKNAATLLQAQTQLELAKANLELAKAQADGLVIKAPIDGVVSELLVHNGDQVGPQTPVTSIAGLKDYDLRVSVDSETASKISLPAAAEIKIADRFITVPIKNISTSADNSSKLVTVTVALPNIAFRANQTLTVRIPFRPGLSATGETSLFVPLDAVIIGTEEQYVYVSQGSKAVKKNVKLGQIAGAKAQIVSGLSEGDDVIVEGAKDLVDGQEISL